MLNKNIINMLLCVCTIVWYGFGLVIHICVPLFNVAPVSLSIVFARTWYLVTCRSVPLSLSLFGIVMMPAVAVVAVARKANI